MENLSRRFRRNQCEVGNACRVRRTARCLVLSGGVHGNDEAMAFNSIPAGAAVSLSNGLQCPSTPCDLKISRKDEFTATFTKDGFRPESVRVTTHVSGGGVAAGAGNILLGGAIGVGVDAYNGANLDHSPSPVDVTLQPVQVGPVKRKGVPTS